ncbi:MAG: hypothetical protein WD696_19270 [Bryobacteraceae bacterium]
MTAGNFLNSGGVQAMDGSFQAGGHFTNHGSLLASGTVTANGLTNHGSLEVGFFTSADFSGGAFGSLNHSGVLTSGNYIIAGTLTYGGGGIGQIGSGASLLLRGPFNQVLNVNGGGTANALSQLTGNAGILALDFGASLNNETANFTNSGQVFLQGGSFAAAYQLINSGTLSLETGAQTSSVDIGEAYVNNTGGFLAIEGGGNTFRARGLTNGGSLAVFQDSTADFSGGTFANLTDGVLTGGEYHVGGTLRYSGDAISSIGEGTSLILHGTGAVIEREGVEGSAISGLSTNHGSLALLSGAAMSPGTQLTNHGTLILELGSELDVGGSGGLIHAGGDATVFGALNSGSNIIQITGGIFDNSGTITGNVSSTGGTYTGGGSLFGSFGNSGVFRPGNSPGTSTIHGDFEQTVAGILQMEMAGLMQGVLGGYDWLNIDGAANLSGLLEVLLLDGFVPNAGDSFTLLSWQRRVGEFSSFHLPGLAEGLVWTTAYEKYGFRLGVANSAAVVPEPGSWAMLAGGALLLVSYRRFGRRRK